MRLLRAWIEDCVGGALAEIEATAPCRASGLAPDSAECLTIRRPVRAGARFYLEAVGRSIVETSWPFAGQEPIWTAALERRGAGWDIVVRMQRPDRAAWLKGGAGLARQDEPDKGWFTGARLRLGAAAVLFAIAIGGPLVGVAQDAAAKAEVARLAETARVAAAPVREAMRARRAAAQARAALAAAASQPGLAGLLADLAGPLPDKARLTSVVIKPGDVRLDGRAPSATAALAAYADAPGLRDVRFDGAVSAIPSGGERFTIIARRTDGAADQ